MSWGTETSCCLIHPPSDNRSCILLLTKAAQHMYRRGSYKARQWHVWKCIMYYWIQSFLYTFVSVSLLVRQDAFYDIRKHSGNHPMCCFCTSTQHTLVTWRVLRSNTLQSPPLSNQIWHAFLMILRYFSSSVYAGCVLCIPGCYLVKLVETVLSMQKNAILL